MLLAGDELGNSQDGNNNSFCQDNEVGWIDWASRDEDMIAFTAVLSRYRRDHPVLRQHYYLHGGVRPADQRPDIEWRDFEGADLNWRDPGLASLCLHLRGSSECARGAALTDEVFVAFNREDADVELVLPDAAPRRWRRDIDTSVAGQTPMVVGSTQVVVPRHSVSAFSLIDSPAHDED